jgi:competence protein ComEC
MMANYALLLLGACLAAERERWILWAPVGIALGAICYFSLPLEPPGWTGAAALAVLLVAGVILRRRHAAVLACIALATPALGWTASQARTAMVAAPVLTREIGPAVVSGRVESIDRLEKGGRVVLTDLSIPRIDSAATPRRVRIRLRNAADLPVPGQRVQIRAVLSPPPAPSEPGAFDFGFTAFFAAIGGVGYAVGSVERIADAPVGLWAGVLDAAERLRLDIGLRIDRTVSGAEGGVLGAFMTGRQTAIPAAVMEDMRASGLAHLLSISGIHVSLVAGIVFFSIRALLALVEPVALRWPIKKLAAVGGLAAAFAYMLVVGSPVPTERSVLMTALAMAAILLDRNPLSLRLVAFAATVVILTEPDSLMGASFQMSFAAVVALISAYEIISRRWARWRGDMGWPGRVLLHLAGVAVTSVIATVATTPFSLYHFQQIQFYGVIANMIAVPVTSAWVMPLVLVSYLALPFGLEEWPLAATGWGITIILETARVVAGLPGATHLVPAMPTAGFSLVVVGGLWLVLWFGRWRLCGIPVALAGFLTLAAVERPDILVDDGGKLMAVRDADGGLSLSSRSAGRFTAQVWLRRDGRIEAGAWPRDGASPDGRLHCDRLGCLYRAKGHVVALVKERQASIEDCASADIVISPDPAPRKCAAALVIDMWSLRRNGVHAVYLRPDGVRVDTVGGMRGQRPWSDIR